MNAHVAMDAITHTLNRLHELRCERALALMTPLGDEPRYMADLDEEITVTTAAYVASAVTEIASLRAALDAPQAG
ncbi:MAG TPA: hypothetical protein VN751_09910 [Solirubrobacteraceae bacterium]|jgi:hypothetical protein|nr:hypothetical protein [Solirubrobacteraceae bacterium]